MVCLQELHEWDNDYSIDPDEMKIKREILFNYQIKTADLYNIDISNVKKYMPTLFVNKCMCFIMKPCNFTWDYD